MTHLILFLLLVMIFGSFAYFRLSIPIWSAATLLTMGIYTHFSLLPWPVLMFYWVTSVAFLGFAYIPSLRQKFLTKPIFDYVKRTLPPISPTEKIALEAGDVWWDAELFQGEPRWSELLSIVPPQLTAEENAFIDNEVETLCKMLNDWEILSEKHDLPEDVWNYIKKEKFFGLMIPQEYEGRGFSALANSTIITKICTRSVSAAVTVMVPNSLGPAELILHYGTPEQKNYYLPRLANGTEVPCFGLTSPFAGSDASGIPDSGIVCKGEYDGKEVLGIKLSWDKRYITLAPVATLLGIAFKLSDPNHLLGEVEDIGITLCLVPSHLPGVETGARHSPLHLAFLNGPTRGKDVFIPLDLVIGGPSMVGQGWRMLMECLSIGRSISLPALSTATGKLCYRTTSAYARIRKQFKLPIGKFEGIEEGLSRIGGFTYLLEACRLMTAQTVSRGLKPSLTSAIAKYHMTEMARTVVNDAMDIHAGRGIQVGPRNYLSPLYLSMPISITVEGANILTRNLIIFGQGAMRCHPYIRQEIEALHQKDALAQFDHLLFSHLGYFTSQFIRTLVYGLTGGHFIQKPKHDISGPYFQQITRMSSALALVSDLTMMILGGDLKRKERLSARLGDVLSYLYLGSCTLKYFHDNQAQTEDAPYFHWAMQHCLYQIQVAFDDFCANFPVPLVGTILNRLIFPWGKAYRKPSDKLSHQIAAHMLAPSRLRDRLSQYCYVGHDRNDATGRMDIAFQKIVAAEAALERLKKSAETKGWHDLTSAQTLEKAVDSGIINVFEAQAILERDILHEEAIRVDEFSNKEEHQQEKASAKVYEINRH